VAACPACGTENSAGAKLCNECAAPLTGDSDAMFRLGVLLEEDDPAAAQTWWTRAVEAGDSDAMFRGPNWASFEPAPSSLLPGPHDDEI